MLGALPWDGVGVLDRKETTEIIKHAKLISKISNVEIQAEIFKVKILHFLINIK